MMSIRSIAALLFGLLTISLSSGQNYTSDIDDETAYRKVMYANKTKALPDGYIVVFNKTRVKEIQNATLEGIVANLDRAGGALEVERVDGLIGMVKLKVYTNATDSESDVDAAKRDRARRLLSWLKNSLVSYMEEDQIVVSTARDQEFPPWGLDRIDQETLPLNNQYHSDNNGTGVTAYIIDTGILETHSEFNGRATCAKTFVPNEKCKDGNGHGTHVAGTIGSTTYGVAKAVSLVGVKVLSDDGSGANSGVISGIEFVLQEAMKSGKPTVCNLSLGGVPSRALNNALEQLSSVGNVVVVVAAGNENVDACLTSPASVSTRSAVISVGATDRSDRRASFSNFGGCVSMFAPGVDIESTWYTNDNAINTISGTSMAAPHVAGVAALYLEDNPDATPEDVKALLLSSSVEGVLFDVQEASPNLLLNTEYLFESTPASPPDSGTDSVISQTSMCLATIATLVLVSIM